MSITALSIIGLVIVYIIFNTMFRTIMFEYVIDATHSNVRLISQEIDNWFDLSNHIVENLSSLWAYLGVGYIEIIADNFVSEFEFITDAIVGFSDGSFQNSNEWPSEYDWLATARPWYIAAEAAQGELIATVPYFSAIESQGVITTVAKWVPDIGGMEAVVGVVITVDAIISMVNEYRLVGGGYLMLIGPGGEIISHPNVEYIVGVGAEGEGGITYLESIPNGEFLMGTIRGGYGITEFDDYMLGPSYLMTFYLEAIGWTLATVLPVAAVGETGTYYLLVIMLTMGAVLVALLLLVMLFMTLLTRNMEERQVAEERLRIVIDNMPLVSNFRDKEFNVLECNEAAAKLFDLSSKEEYKQRFFELSPEFQPDNRKSDEKAKELIVEAFETGHANFEWMHQKLSGEPIPTEVTLIRVEWRGTDNLVAFVRDLRDFYKYKETERIARQRLEVMLDSSPLLVTIFDENSEVLEANREAERLFEIPDKKLYIDDYFAFSPEFQPNGTPSRKMGIDVIELACEQGRSQFEWTYQTSNGELIPCEETIMKVEIEGEDLLIAYTRDLRDFYRYKETEGIAKQRLQAMLNSSPLACTIFDERINVVEVNDVAVELFEMKDANEYIENFFALSPKYQPDGRRSREKMYEKMHLCFNRGRAHFEWMHQTMDGETQIPCEVALVCLTLDAKNLIIAYLRDLREINTAIDMVKQLEKAAYTDPLTGARNRRYFLEEAERELQSCVEDSKSFSAIMVDVDHFKKINDTYGHPVGDEVLKILVARMNHSVKADTMVARYGGEEFVITLPEVDEDSALRTAERIRQSVEASKFAIEEHEIKVTISLGIASKSDNNSTLSDIISNADKALYLAKRSGRNCAVKY